MNPITLRRLALAASAIVATLAVTIVPAATFAADCHPVPQFVYVREPEAKLTAAQIGGSVVNRELDATGCDIGVYNPDRVSNANIHGAKYLGVVVDGKRADVTGSRIHHIGNSPFDGVQRGEAVFYIDEATGTVAGNRVSHFQKNGIVARGGSKVIIRRNKVIGLGPIDYIAQNGIQVSFQGSAIVRGNTVKGMDYTPDGTESCGILYYEAAGVRALRNHLLNNEKNVCQVGEVGPFKR